MHWDCRVCGGGGGHADGGDAGGVVAVLVVVVVVSLVGVVAGCGTGWSAAGGQQWRVLV